MAERIPFPECLTPPFEVYGPINDTFAIADKGGHVLHIEEFLHEDSRRVCEWLVKLMNEATEDLPQTQEQAHEGGQT